MLHIWGGHYVEFEIFKVRLLFLIVVSVPSALAVKLTVFHKVEALYMRASPSYT